MSTHILTVDLGERSYPIIIGRNLLAGGFDLARYMPGNHCLVVTNETVGPLYLEKLQGCLPGMTSRSLALPDGESFKTSATMQTIIDELVTDKAGRDITVVALGGGVVGDIAGFASACYMRGVAFVQVPTTLLAQVDSSVGGKTAINHPLGKNMIGAFYQPRLVLADIATLKSLPERELSAGLAEVIKYGAIMDAGFFAWLEEHMDQLVAREPDALGYAVEVSCRCKAEIVAADERESGKRALLNFGHTFGHAIEAGLGFGTWLHGEAVGAGMLLAAKLSLRLGNIPEQELRRLEHLLSRAGLPTQAPALSEKRYLELMGYDKKVHDGKLRLVLLKSIGEAYLSGDFPADALSRVLAEIPNDA